MRMVGQMMSYTRMPYIHIPRALVKHNRTMSSRLRIPWTGPLVVQFHKHLESKAKLATKSLAFSIGVTVTSH